MHTAGRQLTNSGQLTKAEALAEIFHRLRDLRVVFPDDYLVIDTETSGANVAKDFITQVGWCVVKDRRSVTHGDIVLDWTKSDGVNQQWLGERMATTKQALANRGGQQHTDMRRMADEGLPPVEVLYQYWEMIDGVRTSGGYLLAHGGYHFDVPILRQHFREFLSLDLDPASIRLIDSGLMEKAAQAGMLPWPNDTLAGYFERVADARLRGVYWSLDRHCVGAYGLVEKYQLDMSAAHGAGFDCLCAHLVFEEQRRIVDVAPVQHR